MCEMVMVLRIGGGVAACSPEGRRVSWCVVHLGTLVASLLF